jgi:hypothetical protein
MRTIRALMLAGLLVAASLTSASTAVHPAAAATNAGPAMSIAVTPNPMHNNTDAYVSVLTTPGASCHASVVYTTGQVPSSFSGTYYQKSYLAASNGVVAWPWHQDVNAAGGWALVSCVSHARISFGSTVFTIVQQ